MRQAISDRNKGKGAQEDGNSAPLCDICVETRRGATSAHRGAIFWESLLRRWSYAHNVFDTAGSASVELV